MAGNQNSGNPNADQNLSQEDRVKGGQNSAAQQDMSALGQKGGKAAQQSGNAHDIAQEASKGGKAAHEKGTAHEFTSEEASDAASKRGKNDE